MIYSSPYFFSLESKSPFSSLQIAQSIGLDTFKECYLNYKFYDPLSHKYFDFPKGRYVCV